MRVALRPFGGVPADLLAALSVALDASGAQCVVRDPVPLPQAAFDPAARQFRAEALLAAVPEDDADRVLAVTVEDMYAESLNFVFGLASTGGPRAIVSSFRLRDPRPGLVAERVAKEAVHELGHTVGLPHCRTAGCVMRFSTSLAAADAKGAAFCPSCREKLPPEWPVP